MKMPIERPCSSFGPQKIGSLAPSAMSLEIGIDGWLVFCSGPCCAEQPFADPDRRPVEHDRRDHLVRADRRLENAGDPRVERAGERADRQAQRHVEERIEVDERRTDPDREVRADEILALPTDVEQAATEGKAERDRRENDRRRDQQRLLQVGRGDRRRVPPEPDVLRRERQPDRVRTEVDEEVEPGTVEDRAINLERILADHRDRDPCHQEREDRGQDRPGCTTDLAGVPHDEVLLWRRRTEHPGRRRRRLEVLRVELVAPARLVAVAVAVKPVAHTRSGAGRAGTSAPGEPPSSLRLMQPPPVPRSSRSRAVPRSRSVGTRRRSGLRR